MDLVKGLFEGSRLALARSITAVENEYENAIDIMKAIYPKTGNARILGITGAPGAGKSTLTDKVVKHYLDQGKKSASLPSTQLAHSLVVLSWGTVLE